MLKIKNYSSIVFLIMEITAPLSAMDTTIDVETKEESKKRTFEQSQLPFVEGPQSKELKISVSFMEDFLTLSNDFDENLFSVLPEDARKIINRYMMSPYVFRKDSEYFYGKNPGKIALTIKNMLTHNQHATSGGFCRWFAMAQRWNAITFKSLNLSGITFEGNNFKIFAKALEKNTTLTGLDLSYTKLESDECRYLAEALKVNTSITSLNLYSSIKTLEGRGSLFMALKDENKTVNHLNIGYDQQYNAHSTNIYYLSDSLLTSNKTIRRLHLDGFRLTDKTIKDFIDLITKNKTLCELSLLDSNTNNYIQRILEVIKKNTSLKKLILFRKTVQPGNAVDDVSEAEYLVDEDAPYAPENENALIKAFREEHGDRVEFYV